MFKLQWCVNIANVIVIEKRYLFAEFLFFLIKYTWRNTTKWYFEKKIISISKNPLLNPKSCSTWFFSQICPESGDFPRIIAIALFSFIPPHTFSPSKSTGNTILYFFCLVFEIPKKTHYYFVMQFHRTL